MWPFKKRSKEQIEIAKLIEGALYKINKIKSFRGNLDHVGGKINIIQRDLGFIQPALGIIEDAKKLPAQDSIKGRLSALKYMLIDCIRLCQDRYKGDNFSKYEAKVDEIAIKMSQLISDL